MAFNQDLPSYESTWRNDYDARERAQNEWDERDMQDSFESDLTDAELLDQARQEAAELAQWPITCDGSGILEEIYIAADQTQTIPCQGCPACDMMPADLRGDTRPEPDWMRDPEFVEFGVRRKPATSETRENIPARRTA